MDKENFNVRPFLDPLKSITINDIFRSHNKMLDRLEKERKLAEDREKLIEQFNKYKERNKAE